MSEKWGEWRYITQIRVSTCRQRIESGYSLDDFDERAEANIQTEDVYSGFKQVTATDLEDALPTVDTSGLNPTVSDPGIVQQDTETAQDGDSR